MSEMVFRPKRHRRRASINLTSLIDVLFLLLIFFMLTSTFRRGGEMQLQLPESSTSIPLEQGQERPPTQLVLRADGSILLDGESVVDEDLPSRLKERVEQNPEGKVMLNAEASSRHADVVRMLDLVREAGFVGLSLGTEVVPPVGSRTKSGDGSSQEDR